MNSDRFDVLDRLAPLFEAPEPSFEAFLRRRDRKRRNQRISAGVVGIAVFVAAVWIVTTAGSFDRTTTPAEKPTRNPEGKTAEDVATDFVYEIASFDTDLAVRHLANDAAVSKLRLDGIGEFRRWLSFNEATGFQVIPTSCEKTGTSSLGTYVRCMFDFHGLRSEAIGRGPYSGSYFDLVVHDTPQKWGAIRDVSAYLEFAKFGPQMLDPFIEWVSATYPEDAAVMYTNATYPEDAAVVYTGYKNLMGYRLTPESIRLWEQHTREYVETRSAQTAPPPVRASAAPDVVTQERCSAGARWRLELTKVDSRIKVRFEVYRSPVGHEWRIRLLHHKRFLDPSPWPKARVFFQGTRVASDSGVLAVQVFNHPPPDWSGWGYAGKAVDEQTGQVCEARGGIE